MAEILHLDSETSVEEILNVLDQDAAVIIDNVISLDTVETLKGELGPYLSKEIFGRDEFTGFSTKRVGALIARSNVCRDLALNLLVNNVAKQYLKPFADGYQLHFTSAVSIGPGETKQILHRDRGIWGGLSSKKDRTSYEHTLGCHRIHQRKWRDSDSTGFSQMGQRKRA